MVLYRFFVEKETKRVYNEIKTAIEIIDNAEHKIEEIFDEDGNMISGVIVRHLLLPGMEEDSKRENANIDGNTAMGTMLQSKGILTSKEPERLNITHSSAIIDIHTEYFNAGSNIINTHTFGANSLKYSVDELDEIIKAAVNNAKKAGKKIIGVGTTVLRSLESAVDSEGWIHPFAKETDIFITPPYTFKSIDYLMTNFHLPKSTLFMLVCAFAGMDEMKKAYEFAKENDYRFYSYGDASLLKRKDN